MDLDGFGDVIDVSISSLQDSMSVGEAVESSSVPRCKNPGCGIVGLVLILGQVKLVVVVAVGGSCAFDVVVPSNRKVQS